MSIIIALNYIVSILMYIGVIVLIVRRRKKDE